MHEVRYMISEASKLIDVEQHTLRYWEEELELNISRNEMGHRYYKNEDIELLKAIKILKEKGYQLRAIKMLIPTIQKNNYSSVDSINKLRETCDKQNFEELSDNKVFTAIEQGSKNNNDKVDRINCTNKDNTTDKLEQFNKIMKNLVNEALENNNGILAEVINEEVTNSVIKEMDYLLRIKEEREEERFKRFDRTIREVQNAREQAAATKAFRKKKKYKFFK